MKKQKRAKLPSLSRLRRKAMAMWSESVRSIHGNKCEICGKPHDKLNAHHIEPRTNSALRYDIANGAALCPSCHKFGRDSAHRSVLFFYEWLASKRPRTLDYIRGLRTTKVEYDRERINAVLATLSSPPSGDLLDIVGVSASPAVSQTDVAQETLVAGPADASLTKTPS